jgi:hypothetical protein
MRVASSDASTRCNSARTSATAHMAAVGATPSGPVIAEDIYCLLSQSFFSEYSRLNEDSELVRMDRACRRARVCQGAAWKRWSKPYRQSAGRP